MQIPLVTFPVFFFFLAEISIGQRAWNKLKSLLPTERKDLNLPIVYKFLLFSLRASFSPSNFRTHNFLLKCHAFASLIVSHSSTKAAI